MAGEALLVVLDVLAAVHVEEEEVVEVAFGEELPLLGTWRLNKEQHLAFRMKEICKIRITEVRWSRFQLFNRVKAG